ncbi:hypothetical protein [Haliea sp.]|uniref:hypothetical protein n=1 Tax=Haliea sp. TaxID=1932666 RepID=UPI00257FE13B|nr:hypothetical protein [Haliea sp.]
MEQEEIQKLSQIQEQQQNFIIELGKLEYDITLLEFEKEKIQEKIEQVVQKSQTLAKELEDKYGSGTINLEKGEFYPQ